MWLGDISLCFKYFISLSVIIFLKQILQDCSLSEYISFETDFVGVFSSLGLSFF